ncbi:MAG: NUDIX domain-containing protein [Bacteroidota bacterium]
MKRLVDVYPYREGLGAVSFLIFKRAADVRYGGQWRMIGGKVLRNESHPKAALRELEEESGLQPDLFWSLPSLNQFYDHSTDHIFQIPAFGALITNDPAIRLNHEHVDWKWISKDEIDSYILWPEQRRLMKLLADIVINNQIIDEWIIDF